MMIVLIGFMGAGKTTIGQLLAEHLGLPFIDSDEVIERAEGMAVREIFEARGEAAFREIEAVTIVELLAGPDVVLALGGGALTSRNLAAALAGHQVVLLDVAFDEAMERVAGDSRRPLLHQPNLSGLYEGRQADYREASTVAVPVSGRAPREIVADVLTALGLDSVGE